MATDRRCALGWHRFLRKHAPETDVPSFYLECARCGKFRDVPGLPPEVGLG